MRWAVIWAFFMLIICGLYFLGIWQDAASLYTATIFCWIINCLIGNASFTATCFVGTGLSLWKAWERLREFVLM